jgi:SIR2-like domain
VNIESTDRAEIARGLNSNSLVLFVGAGFSVGATNQLDEHMPTGGQLCEKLWHFLRLTPPYDGRTALKDLYELCLARDKTQLSFLLKSLFVAKDVPGWYQLLTKPYWFRVYTTNVDDVVERTYGHPDVRVRLDVVDGAIADYKDRDQFLSTLQFIKLNGTNLDSPESLTFSLRQYARRSSENSTWYDHFVRDFSTYPVVFLGSQLDEPLFWQAVEARGKRFGGKERRSKAYIVTPHVDEVTRQKFSALNLIPIEGTAEEFLEIVSRENEQLSREQILAHLHPDLALSLSAAGQGQIGASHNSLQEFLSAFRLLRPPDHLLKIRKDFLLGSKPDWSSIFSHLDAPRDCADSLREEIQRRLGAGGPSAVLVSGSAGSGKSTIMMRAAADLAAAGTQVFFLDQYQGLAPHHIAPALAAAAERFVVFIDDAAGYLTLISAFAEANRVTPRQMVLVVGERSNRRGRVLQRLSSFPDAPEIFDLPNLSDRDIDALIDKLTEFNLLGKLAGKTRDGQRYEFSFRAEKQILVAMREATKGEDFNLIIFNEFESIESDEAKIAYLSICLGTSFGAQLSLDQFVSFTDLFPNEALLLLDNQLREIVIRTEPHRRSLRARHRVIADALLDGLAPRSLVKTAYIRLLQTLAHDIEFSRPKHSRSFELYRDVINHDQIRLRFRADIQSARDIFSSLEAYLRDDYHFFHQYASLELEYGELATAENYLTQAEELAPRSDPFIQTTKALLFYKQSAHSSKIHEAAVLRDEARNVLIAQIEARPDDPYPAHILCAQELAWWEKWPTKVADRRKLINGLRDDVTRYAKKYPFSSRLGALKERIDARYLDFAKPGSA